MKNPVALRIKELRNHYNLGVKDFARKAGLSHAAIFNLENGKTNKPHKSSIQRIASVYGSTSEWLLYGNDEMLPNGRREFMQHEDNWKEEAYQEVKRKNVMLEKEIERLWEMIGHFASGTKPDLNRVLQAS
jgi:transcriptional regulator with XRE-family HTH domain